MRNKFEIANCPCGKKHIADIDDIIVENGAIDRLPEVINGYGAKKAFILADVNTYKAAAKGPFQFSAKICSVFLLCFSKCRT